MPTKPTTQVKLNAAGQKRLAKEVFTIATFTRLKRFSTGKPIRALGMALVAPVASPAAILTPTAESKELTNFAYPNLGEDDMPTDGGYTFISVTVLQWLSKQNDFRIHFLYRVAGETGPDSWRKPPIVIDHDRLGMSALVLRSGAYEFAVYNPK